MSAYAGEKNRFRTVGVTIFFQRYADNFFGSFEAAPLGRYLSSALLMQVAGGNVVLGSNAVPRGI